MFYSCVAAAACDKKMPSAITGRNQTINVRAQTVQKKYVRRERFIFYLYILKARRINESKVKIMLISIKLCD